MAKGTCTVDGCNDNELCRDLCKLHYERLRRTGSVHLKTRRTAVESFWAKVNKNGPIPSHRPELGPCWLWTAHIMRTGYGQFCHGGKSGRKDCAHRYAYQVAVGPIPDGLHIDHLCRVRACVNPTHLEAVTQDENNRRCEWRATTNARKTHCKNGHEFTPENTYYSPSRGRLRACRTCVAAFNLKPTCKRGHRFDEANTIVTATRRICRTCREARVGR